MSFFEVLGPDVAPPSLNTTLAGLATLVQSAVTAQGTSILQTIPVYAQPITIDETTAFPLIQIMPYKYRVQEIASGERGTVPSGTGALGASRYYIWLLWSPLSPDLDLATAAPAMNDVVDAIINAWAGDGAYLLPDEGGVPQVEDSALALETTFGPQGSQMQYISGYYLGCYITVDVIELTRP